MWVIKLKAANEQDKRKLLDTDESLSITRAKGGEFDKSKGGQISGECIIWLSGTNKQLS